MRKKIMNRAIAALIILFVCITGGYAFLLFGVGDYDTGDSIDTLEKFNGYYDAVTIKKYKGGDANVFIPNTLNGKKVNSISLFAFANNQKIVSVVVPDTIIAIERNAFQSCRSLKSIQLPNNIKSIGHEAFKDCASLGAVTIPNSVNKIDDDAFAGCTNLSIVSDNPIGHFALARDKYFPKSKRNQSVTIDEQLTAYKKAIRPYIHSKYEGEKIRDYLRSSTPKLVSNISFTATMNDEDTLLSGDNFGDKPTKKILILEKWGYDPNDYKSTAPSLQGYNNRINLGFAALIPPEYLPENLSEVEYIINLTHRRGHSERYIAKGASGATGSLANTVVEIVVYESSPLAGSFKKIKSVASVASELPKQTQRVERFIEPEDAKLVDPIIESIGYIKGISCQ